MQYTENPQLATELINAIEAQLSHERAERTDWRPHVSDLIYCLRAAWRKRQLIANGESISQEDEDQRLVLLIGQALHTIVAKALGHEANVRLENEWLVGEADARMLVEDNNVIIEEFKTTRTGFSLDDPVKYPHYIEQVASYLVLARSMGFPTLDAVLHALHLTFSNMPRWYEPHPKKLKKETQEEYEDRLATLRTQKRAEYEQAVADWIQEQGKHSNLRSWPLKYTEGEIDAWEVELKRRQVIFSGDEEPSADENVPAGKSGQSWTCDYCPFHIKKGGDCPGSIGRPSNFFPIDFFNFDDFVESNNNAIHGS